MGKQKYPTTAGGSTIVEGERKQRDHSKSGLLARRREGRRLDAIARQVRRIQALERALEKAKKKGPAQAKVTHAQLTLQKIRGGTPQAELEKKFAVEPTK